MVKAAHLGDTAGVVGDRTVSVNCDGDAGGGKHTDCCECDAVKACELVSKEDAYADKQDRYPSGHHADCGTGNDGGSRTGLGLLSNLLNELVVAGGVDLGDNADNETDNEAGDDCDSAAHAAEHRLAEDEGSNNDEKCGNIRAHLKSLVGVRAFLTAHKEGGDNGSKNAAGCDNEGEDNTVGGVGNSDSTEGHCGDDSTDIALKQVSTHTGDIADIVADIVSDNSGVTRVILGDACLDLTDEVSTDIGCLGVDTAADTGKQSDRGSTEREAEEDIQIVENQVQNACAEKAEADNAHTHDRAAGEGNRQSLVHAAFTGSVCGADICLGGDIHADVAGENGECCAAQEANSGDPAVKAEAYCDEQNSNKDSKDPILGKEESASAITDCGGYFLHAVGACILLGNKRNLVESKKQSDDCQRGGQPDKRIHFLLTPIKFLTKSYWAVYVFYTNHLKKSIQI